MTTPIPRLRPPNERRRARAGRHAGHALAAPADDPTRMASIRASGWIGRLPCRRHCKCRGGLGPRLSGPGPWSGLCNGLCATGFCQSRRCDLGRNGRKYRDYGCVIRCRYLDLDPDCPWCGAQYCSCACLYDLPRDYRGLARAAGDYCRHFAGCDLWFRPPSGLSDPVFCDHRLSVETAGRGYRKHGPITG